jgi:hypothetical protein
VITSTYFSKLSMHNFTERYAVPGTDGIIKFVLICVLYRPCLLTQFPVPEKCVSVQNKFNVLERKTYLCLSIQQEHRSNSIYTSSAVVTLFTIILNSQKLKIITTEFIYVFYVNLRTNGDHFTRRN